MIIRLTLLGLSLLFLSACSIRQHSEADLLRLQLMQTRSNLQHLYADLSNELWQRAHILPDSNSSLPLKSNDPLVLEKINQDLRYKINQAQTHLTSLNYKIQQIKTKQVAGARLSITLQKGLWHSDQKVVSTVSGKELQIIAGEKVTWDVSIYQQGTQEVVNLPLSVTLSERGLLFFGRQKVATLSLQQSSQVTLNNVAVFAQNPFPIGYMDITLTSHILP